MVLATGAKSGAAEGLLRRLGVAIKAVSLYPPPHPVTDRAIAELHARVLVYAEAHGPFVVRVSKKALAVDGTAFEEGVHQTLAFALYTRRVATVAIMPAVGVEELASFVSIVGRDRRAIEASGGVVHLLWQAGVENIQAVEVSVKSDALTLGGEPPSSEGPTPLLDIGGRLSPLERERVIETLRAGPEVAGKLLESLSAASAEGEGPEAQAERVYHTLRHLDRLIMDQPVEEQPELAALLADASMHLDESVRAELDRTLLARVTEDVTADLLVGHFSTERLARAVLSSVAQDKVSEQVATLLIGAHVSREKAQAVLAILDERLRPAGEKPEWLIKSVWPLIQASHGGPDKSFAPEVEVDEQPPGISDDELAVGLEELRAADDAGITREVVRTFVDVLLTEDDSPELAETASLLEEQLAWLVERNEFALLADVLRGMHALATSPSASQREIAARIRQAIAADATIEKLVALLWESRGTPIEQDILRCLGLAGEAPIGPLVSLLGNEPLAGRRLMICDVLAAIGRPHIDAIARNLSDPRPDTVGHIVAVLGRLAHPGVVPHLARVRRHAEYGVRREITDALARIGTEDAQSLLAQYLDDPDPRIRVRAIGALNVEGVRRSVRRLEQVLRQPDWFNRRFEIRQAVLAAAERFGDPQILPVVRRLARRRLCLGSRGREIRRLARAAEAAVGARHSNPPPGPPGPARRP
jgi:HEAT repeat protein